MIRYKLLRVASALSAALFAVGMGQAAAEPGYSVFDKQYVGLWNGVDHSGWRSVTSFNADGTCTESDHRYGTWQVDHDQLTMRFDGHSDWQDHYTLPIQDGTIKGRTAKGDALRLVRRDSSAPAASYAALAGTWDFHNVNDGHRATVVFAPNGAITEDGQPIGYWQIEGTRLAYSFRAHHEWTDFYDLPPKDGVLHGRNVMNHALTLSRVGSAVVAGPGAATAGTTQGTPASTVHAPAAQGSGYFGKTGSSVVASDGSSRVSGIGAPPPTIAPLTAPITTVIARGSETAATTPVIPSGTPTPEPSAAETLTPVGKWHWHSGAEHLLTDKGAIMEGTHVAGQWKWLDKSKSQIQVQWTGGAYRPPMTYTLSPHGNHLSGKSPSSGQDHTEDRIE